MSISRWVDKQVVVHIHNGILLSHKKESIWVSSNEVNEPIIQSGVSQKKKNKYYILTHIFHQIRSDQLLSHVRLLATPWIAARQASLSITNSWSSLRLTSIQSVMPSSHLILCRPLLLLPPIPPSIEVFSNESTLCMRWPKYWSFSFSIIPSKEIPEPISFTSWQIDGETVETVADFILGGSKITADGDCSHEIKRCLLLGRKAMTKLLLLLSYFSRVRLCATP